MTCKDKASYEFSLPCNVRVHLRVCKLASTLHTSIQHSTLRTHSVHNLLRTNSKICINNACNVFLHLPVSSFSVIYLCICMYANCQVQYTLQRHRYIAQYMTHKQCASCTCACASACMYLSVACIKHNLLAKLEQLRATFLNILLRATFS